MTRALPTSLNNPVRQLPLACLGNSLPNENAIPAANTPSIVLLTAGKSSGFQLVISRPSITTASSVHSAPHCASQPANSPASNVSPRPHAMLFEKTARRRVFDLLDAVDHHHRHEIALPFLTLVLFLCHGRSGTIGCTISQPVSQCQICPFPRFNASHASKESKQKRTPFAERRFPNWSITVTECTVKSVPASASGGQIQKSKEISRVPPGGMSHMPSIFGLPSSATITTPEAR
jgi:hypothetical protein